MPNPPFGAASPKVWAKARTCPVHAVLGRFCKALLTFNILTAYIGDYMYRLAAFDIFNKL
jgi:hypothetical protein